MIGVSSATPIQLEIGYRTLVAVFPPGLEAPRFKERDPDLMDELEAALPQFLATNDASDLLDGYGLRGNGVALFHVGDDGSWSVGSAHGFEPKPVGTETHPALLILPPTLPGFGETAPLNRPPTSLETTATIVNPEPASLFLLGTGLLACALYARRRSKASRF